MSDEDDLDEEYIFIHNSNSQIKLQIPDKKSIKQLEFNYLNDEIFTKKKRKKINHQITKMLKIIKLVILIILIIKISKIILIRKQIIVLNQIIIIMQHRIL